MVFIYELNGIEIDSCPACGGSWLDTGELELIYEMEGMEVDESVRALATQQSEGLSTKRRCLRCNAKLEILKAGSPTVEIDRCPIGHGYWFDQGELLTLMKTSSTLGTGLVSQFFRELFQARYPQSDKENKS